MDAILTPLEKAVLDTLLDRPGAPFETIRQQLSHATVATRKFTSVGFFTDFTLPADAPVSRDLSDQTIGGVGASFPGVEHGAGFMLFIRGGIVRMLEGYTYADDQWPESTDEFTVFKTAA